MAASYWSCNRQWLIGGRRTVTPLVAIDTIGAGTGERVMITSDGAGTRKMLNADATPVRWSVIGIEDE